MKKSEKKPSAETKFEVKFYDEEVRDSLFALDKSIRLSLIKAMDRKLVIIPQNLVNLCGMTGVIVGVYALAIIGSFIKLIPNKQGWWS